MYDDSPLFPPLTLDDVDVICSYGTPRQYPKNSILVNKDDESDGVYVIQDGKVRVYISDEFGDEMVFGYLGPGEFFGELAILDNRPRTASVSTLNRTHAFYLGRSKFEKCLAENPDLSLKFIRHMVGRIATLTDELANCALKNVYQRLSDKLIQLALEDSEGWLIPDRMTHKELAGLVGSRREMVTRILGKLRDAGYIETASGNLIRILKPLPRNLPD